MAMLSLLRNHPGYALASTLKLRLPVLSVSYVGTRHFLTTSPDHSPAQQAGKEANSQNSTEHKSDGKPEVQAKKKSEKPKRFTKKDLTPPSKRPLSSFATFALEYRAKQLQNGDTTTSVPLADTLRDAAAAWAKFSAAEKQTYAPSREAVEAHKVALKNWQDSLSVEARKALKLRRRRERGTGYALFLSETFKQAMGDTFGEKVSDRATVWKSFSSEAKAEYAKRAADTIFGVRIKRAAQHERQAKKEANKKAEAEIQKAKDKAKKKAERAKQKVTSEQTKKKMAASK